MSKDISNLLLYFLLDEEETSSSPIWTKNKVYPQFVHREKFWGWIGGLIVQNLVILSIMIMSHGSTVQSNASKSGKILPRWTFYNPLELKKSSVHCTPSYWSDVVSKHIIHQQFDKDFFSELLNLSVYQTLHSVRANTIVCLQAQGAHNGFHFLNFWRCILVAKKMPLKKISTILFQIA